MSSSASWHVSMAKWVAKGKAAETVGDIEAHDTALQVIETWRWGSSKWQLMTLNTLFSGTKPSHLLKIVEADEEEIMQKMIAEALEDERPDDGAIKISSDDEWW